MTLLGGIVLYESGERQTLSGRKMPVECRSVYFARRVSEEDGEILKKYYLSERARSRLTGLTPKSRRIRRILVDYDESVLCIPWKVYWRDRGNPKHPFSVIQSRSFKQRGFGDGERDITGGLAYWVSEHGRVKNRVLHETIDDVLMAYLSDTVPMYNQIVSGDLSGGLAAEVTAEIARRADDALADMTLGYSHYSLPASVDVSVSSLAKIGRAEVRRVSAEASARAWLTR